MSGSVELNTDMERKDKMYRIVLKKFRYSAVR
jgi:hypothetical protein